MSYDVLEQKFIAWAGAQEAVRAAVVVGSRARPALGDHPPDAWSDLDLILFVAGLAPFLSDSSWLQEMGEIWLAVPGQTGRGDPEWDVIYAGGDKVDFVLVEAGEEGNLCSWLAASPYRFVLERGIRILVEKCGTGETDPGEIVFPFPPSPRQAPSPETFTQAVRLALLAAGRAARFLARGDLWRARRQVECVFKSQLLEMLEWHALARGEPQADPWYDGRYLEEWADPKALAELPHTASAYDLVDVRKALEASLALYLRLARESSGRLGLPYPQAEVIRIESWIHSIPWKN